MRDYVVSYYLGEMYHTYTVEAKNEYEATMKALRAIPEGSQKHFRKFHVEMAERGLN